jgi:hypothetical protein
LFRQDGGDVYGEFGENIFSNKVFAQIKQGKISLGYAFTEPIAAMWPSAVVQNPGHVAMQNESEIACVRHGRERN